MRQIANGWRRLVWSDTRRRLSTNDIDIDVLRYLTDADLEKIGISLGHRRKLLAAIAELSSGAAAPAQPPSELNSQEDAERREPTPTDVAPPSPFASAEVAGRTPLSHGYVLRPGGFDRHYGSARCRGVA